MKTRSNATARLRNLRHWCRRSLDPDGCAQWPGIHTTHRLYSRRSVHAGVSELTSRLRDGLIILRQSRRLYGLLAPQRGRIATDKVKSIHCEPRVLTGDSCAKRNILPELSTFCCLPGKAGGYPYGLANLNCGAENPRPTERPKGSLQLQGISADTRRHQDQRAGFSAQREKQLQPRMPPRTRLRLRDE